MPRVRTGHGTRRRRIRCPRRHGRHGGRTLAGRASCSARIVSRPRSSASRDFRYSWGSFCREGPPPVSFSPDGHDRTRLLRDPGRRAQRDRRRHQARLPQARPAVAPRRQHATRRRTSGSRRSTRPTRSCPTRERRQRYDMFGRAGVDGGAGGAGVRRLRRVRRLLATSSTRSSAAAPAPRRPGAGGRSPARTCATTCGSPSRRRSTGPRRRSSSRRSSRCETCPGSGAEPGTRADHLPAVQRPRRGPLGPPDDARPDGQRQRLSALPRRGQDRRDAVRHLPRRRPHRTQAHAAGHDPGGHRRGPPDPALERGRGRAARRAARQPVRGGPRPAASER